MHVILFLVFGLVVGAVARIMVPGSERGGWAVSLLIGAAGATLGGFLGRLVGPPAGFVTSVLGAVVFVVAYHVITMRRRLV